MHLFSAIHVVASCKDILLVLIRAEVSASCSSLCIGSSFATFYSLNFFASVAVLAVLAVLQAARLVEFALCFVAAFVQDFFGTLT